MYEVRANDRIADGILQISEQFWHSHVLAKEPPDGLLPSIESLKRLKREPGLTVDLPDDLVAEFQAAKEQEKQAAEIVEVAQQKLLNAIGAAEAGRWSGGLVTYLEQTRKSYQVKESTFRTIRVKSDKRTLVKS